MSKFNIRAATEADIPSLIEIQIAAFEDDAVVGSLDRNVDPAVRKEKGIEWYKDQMGHAYLTGAVFSVAEEVETGKVVAFSKWDYPTHLTETQKAEKAEWLKATMGRPPPEGANEALYKDFFAQLIEGRKIVDTEKDYFLHILCVSPTHHRRGLGGLLIRRGLDRADADGARTYIEASEKGLPLYLRHGWVPREFTITIDLGKHGCGQGISEGKTLMRPAKKVGADPAEAADVGAVKEAEP